MSGGSSGNGGERPGGGERSDGGERPGGATERRPPGTSPPVRGTQRAHAFWRAARPVMFSATVLFGLLAAVGGPILLYQLIVRGVRESRPSWLALGVICAIPWLLVVYAATKRALHPRAAEPPPSAPPDKRGGNGAPGGDDVGR